METHQRSFVAVMLPGDTHMHLAKSAFHIGLAHFDWFGVHGPLPRDFGPSGVARRADKQNEASAPTSLLN
jgi:hypothetical protein